MACANVIFGRLSYRTSQDPSINMLIWDTGVSSVFTPFKSKFIDDVKCNIPVKDVTKFNTVIGIGTTIHNFVDANGKYLLLPFIYYHLPTTDVQLLYSKNYHKLHGAKYIIKGLNVKI